MIQPGDIKVFFVLHVAMGLVRKLALKSYWSTDLMTHTPFFREHMSLNNFKLISQKTHLNNDTKNLAPSEPLHDPLAKIRHIVSTLQNTFHSSLALNRALGLDEVTCAFHGVCRFHAFNPAKPDKYHLKLYAVSEVDYDTDNNIIEWPSVMSLTQWHHDVRDDSILKFGASPVMPGTQVVGVLAIVMQLMHKYSLLDQGYHLYTDNFYSSPHLATAVLHRSTGFCGTVQSNKKLCPVALITACGGRKKIGKRHKRCKWCKECGETETSQTTNS